MFIACPPHQNQFASYIANRHLTLTSYLALTSLSYLAYTVAQLYSVACLLLVVLFSLLYFTTAVANHSLGASSTVKNNWFLSSNTWELKLPTCSTRKKICMVFLQDLAATGADVFILSIVCCKTENKNLESFLSWTPTKTLRRTVEVDLVSYFLPYSPNNLLFCVSTRITLLKLCVSCCTPPSLPTSLLASLLCLLIVLFKISFIFFFTCSAPC